jgi:exopolysaccharide biosynthesis predicted pyruvyltransferase EpsI
MEIEENICSIKMARQICAWRSDCWLTPNEQYFNSWSEQVTFDEIIQGATSQQQAATEVNVSIK